MILLRDFYSIVVNCAWVGGPARRSKQGGCRRTTSILDFPNRKRQRALYSYIRDRSAFFLYVVFLSFKLIANLFSKRDTSPISSRTSLSCPFFLLLSSYKPCILPRYLALLPFLGFLQSCLSVSQRLSYSFKYTTRLGSFFFFILVSKIFTNWIYTYVRNS